MPSFPDSVFAPANRSNGQTIDASHMNGVQDEIVAIEGGYRNGTAPLNSSGSTVVTLQVTGGSSFAGGIDSTLSVASSVTLRAGLTVSSGGMQISSGSTFAVRPVMPPPESVKVFLASTRTPGSSAQITWDAQDYITNSSLHSTATNTGRFVPQTTGVYQLIAQIQGNYSTGESTVDLRLSVRDSSGGVVAVHSYHPIFTNPLRMQVIGVKRFDAVGGYLDVAIGQEVASSGSLSSGIGASWAEFRKL